MNTIGSLKLNKTTYALTALAALAFSSQDVRAADGTITFEGELTAVTCTIGPGGGSAGGAAGAVTVKLPTMANVGLAQNGDTDGERDFSLKFGGADCAAQDGKVGEIRFGATNVDAASGRVNTGVQNLQIQVLENGVPLNLTTDALNFTVNATGDNEFPLSARYYANGGQAAIGAVNAAIEYTVQFN